MAQQNNEHPTNAQLSAYLDTELAPEELALCAAHIQTCQTCQDELADLRLTSSLLRGMPQVEVPRSFALPLNISVLPSTPTTTSIERHVLRPSRGQYILKRSLRALSTMAAVVGLIFILAGVLSVLPPRGAMTNSPAASMSAPQHLANTAPTQPQRTTGTGDTSAGVDKKTPIFGDKNTPVVSTPGPTTTTEQGGQQPQPAGLPSTLDLGQPEGRLGIGFALFLLGILGVILTRRFRRDPAY